MTTIPQAWIAAWIPNRWLAPPAKICRPYRDLGHRRLLDRPSLRHVRRNNNCATQTCVNTEFSTAQPEALADPRRRKSASASASRNKGNYCFLSCTTSNPAGFQTQGQTNATRIPLPMLPRKKLPDIYYRSLQITKGLSMNRILPFQCGLQVCFVKSPRSGRRLGFTLVELLVVIAIIGVLVLIRSSKKNCESLVFLHPATKFHEEPK